MLSDKIRANSHKILIFIINLLIMTVAFLLIRDDSNHNRNSTADSGNTAPPNQDAAKPNNLIENQVIVNPPVIDSQANNQTNSPAITNTNPNKNSAQTSANTNSVNSNTNINRRTRTS